MHESEEPLTTFFRTMLPAARDAGYKLVITLLAREADSEEIFKDLERYWHSLDDVTGDHVLFVLGAARAHKKLSGSGLVDRNNAVVHVSADVAISGSRSICWHGSGRRPATRLAESHTEEMTELRRYFDVPESSIPSLLITSLDSLIFPRRNIIPLSSLGGRPIYQYLKELVGHLDSAFSNIDRASHEIELLNKELREIERRIPGVFISSSYFTPSPLTPSSSASLKEIIAICKSHPKDLTGKRRCFDLLRPIAEEAGSHSGVVSSMQSLIDRAFYYTSKQGQVYQERKEIAKSRLEPAIDIRDRAWEEIHKGLDGFLRHTSNITSAGWDFFVTYSSDDYEYAHMLYDALSVHGSVFLDRLCLLPGDIWPQKLRAEQGKSKSTIVLITQDIDQSWFASSEYIHAIELTRIKSHIVIPILMGDAAQPPYGLEQVQAIRQDDGGDFKATAAKVAAAVNTIK